MSPRYLITILNINDLFNLSDSYNADQRTTSDGQMATTPETTTTPIPSDDTKATNPEPTNHPIQAPINCEDPSTVCFKNRTFTEFPTKDIPQNATTVELKNSNITTLKQDALGDLSSLETLVLCSNNIAVIVLGVFRDQKKLKHLDLGDNSLTTINPAIWIGLASLKTLRISGNKLQSLPPDAFANLPELKVLAVDFNLLVLEKQKLFDQNTFSNPTKQPQIGLEQDDRTLVCNSSNCWLKEKEEKGLLVHYEKNGKPFRPKCSDNPAIFWDQADLKCSGKISFRSETLHFVLDPILSDLTTLC